MITLIRSDINVDFLKMSKPFVLASTIAVLVSIGSLFYPGLNYGIDFTGGAEIHLKTPESWDIGKVRAELEAGGIKDPSIVQLGAPTDHTYLVKVQTAAEALNTVSGKVESIMSAKAEKGTYELQKVDVVGPQAGDSLKKSAVLSLVYAALGIVAYIAFRFDIRFAPGILRSLLFDVLITLGIWVLLGREFSLITLASLLTIAGYSCNDTIIIYDRIRDLAKMHPSWPLEKVVNRSINLNLGRTFLTSGCTCFVVVSLWLLGGSVLGDFALCMFIGFTISIFSAIFVANPLVVYMENRRLAKLAGNRGLQKA